MKKFNTKYIGYAVLVLLALFIGISLFLSTRQKTYTSGKFSITMDSGFTEKQNSKVDVYFESVTAGVTAKLETFDELKSLNIDKDSELSAYKDAISLTNKLDSNWDTLDGKFMYTTYEKAVSGTNFFYTVVVCKSDSGFWIINLWSRAQDKKEFQDKFIKWIKTIEVK